MSFDLSAISFLVSAQAGPIPSPQKRGKLSLGVASTSLLGNQHSSTTYVKRDTGFHGSIGTTNILTCGDTMFADAENCNAWRGMVSGSAAIATTNPMVVEDPNLSGGFPQQYSHLGCIR